MFKTRIHIDICSIEIINDPALPWLVMIHGFGGTRHMWNKQVDRFKGRFNIMVVERPGHGDAEDGVAEYPQVDFTEIGKHLLNHFKKKQIQKAHFLCVSLGSLVMAALIQLRPEIVESVLLCGAIFGMEPVNRCILHFGNAIKPLLPYMSLIRLLAMILMPRRSHKISRKFLVQECKKLGRQEFQKWYELLCLELNRLRDNIALFARTRTLVIMGREDYMFFTPSQKTLAGYPAIHSLVMEHCGHVCSLQKWREFNVIAGEFFENHRLPDKDVLDQLQTTVTTAQASQTI